MSDDLRIRLSMDQVAELANLERQHGSMVRIDRETHMGETIMEGEFSDSFPWFCPQCGAFFIIDFDGDIHVYPIAALGRLE